jgi:predicted nucleic acid-binding protein
LYLVDTNILSVGAPARAVAMPSLMDLMHRNSARLFLSAIAIAEVEDGIAKNRRLCAHRKAERLSEWLGTVLHLYGARALPIDPETARRIGVLSDLARGQAPGLADIAIAATAQRYGYTVLTRNLQHFGPLGVLVVDPLR